MKNTSGQSCELRGNKATIVYVNSAGKTATLPARQGSRGKPASPIVKPGQQVATVVTTINQYGGYDPSSPECAHPYVYRNLSLKFGNGSLLPLKGLVLDVKCGDIWVYDWA